MTRSNVSIDSSSRLNKYISRVGSKQHPVLILSIDRKRRKELWRSFRSPTLFSLPHFLNEKFKEQRANVTCTYGSELSTVSGHHSLMLLSLTNYRIRRLYFIASYLNSSCGQVNFLNYNWAFRLCSLFSKPKET